MRIKVKVIAGARKESISDDGDHLKVKLTARPIKGKANEALIEALAKHFNIQKSKITILHGHTSNKKEIEILD